MSDSSAQSRRYLPLLNQLDLLIGLRDRYALLDKVGAILRKRIRVLIRRELCPPESKALIGLLGSGQVCDAFLELGVGLRRGDRGEQTNKRLTAC